MRILQHTLFRAGKANHPQQLHGALFGFLLVHVQVEAQRFTQLIADRKDGVQARHRLLKNHSDFVALNLAHFLGGKLKQICTLVDNFAAADFAADAWHKPHYAHAADTLAAAAFADDAQRLPFLQGEVHVTDGLPLAAALVKGDFQVLDFENHVSHKSTPFSARFRVERVTQAVANQVDAQHRHQNAQSRRKPNPRAI